MGFFSALSLSGTGATGSAHGPAAGRPPRSLPIGHIAPASAGGPTSGRGRERAGDVGGSAGGIGGDKARRERWYSVFTRHHPPPEGTAGSASSPATAGLSEARIHAAYTSRDTVREPPAERRAARAVLPSEVRDKPERSGQRTVATSSGGNSARSMSGGQSNGVLPKQEAAVGRTSGQRRDAQLARRLQWLERSNDGGQISCASSSLIAGLETDRGHLHRDADYRTLRKAALQRHAKLSDPNGTQRAGLLNADSLASLRASRTAQPEHNGNGQGSTSIFSGNSSRAHSTHLLSPHPHAPLQRNKFAPLASQAPPSSYRTVRPPLITAWSSSSSVASAESGPKTSSANRSIRSRFSGMGMRHDRVHASGDKRAISYGIEDDGAELDPPLVVEETTPPIAIRQELKTAHQQAHAVHAAYEEAVQSVCDELGVGEADLRVLLADVEDIEEPGHQEESISKHSRKVSRSHSDSRLLDQVSNGESAGHTRKVSSSMRSASGLGKPPSMRPHRRSELRSRSPIPPLPNGTHVEQPSGTHVNGTSRPPNGSIARSTTSIKSSSRAHTPSFTIYSVDRVSIPLSIATTITADPSTKLTKTDLQRVRALIGELQTLRMRQEDVDAAFVERIAWLREAERTAELRQRARR